MNIYAKKGHKVRYIGANDYQVRWGSCDDPRQLLTEGAIYSVDHTEVHSMHTKVYLEGYKGRFNSASFEDVASDDAPSKERTIPKQADYDAMENHDETRRFKRIPKDSDGEDVR